MKHSLTNEKNKSVKSLEELNKWRLKSKKYLDGLSKAIDDQLSDWRLTKAEKDVAFLLLKGFSLKEIAKLRNTTEKTSRTQSITVYSKSGLSGRSQLLIMQ